MAAWLRRKPSGRNHARLLGELAARQPTVARALARAFLRAGDFACEATVEQEECGAMVSETVMGTLKPSARPGDACLNRALALWALKDGGLVDEDVKTLVDELAEIAKMSQPERELPDKVADLMRGRGDSVRLSWLAALPDDIAAANVKGLSGQSLRELFSEHGIEAALLELDPKQHREFLLEAMRSDSPSLSDETLDKLLDHFVDERTANVETTLRWLAKNGPCAASMTAALAMADRGDPSFLPAPRRPSKDESEQAATWALCRISHDPDADRQVARYKEFLPRHGEVVIEHTGEAVSPDEQETRFTRKEVTEWNLPSETFAPTCTSGDCAAAPTATIHFLRGKDGVLYLNRVVIHRPYTTC